MPETVAIFTSTLFDQSFTEPEAAPPGRDLANCLLKAFSSNGLSHFPNVEDEVEKDDWEHSEWFFFIQFQEVKYTVFVTCTLEPEKYPGRWAVSFHKQRGLFRSLFLPNREEDLPVLLRQHAERILKDSTKCESVEWISNHRAADYLW